MHATREPEGQIEFLSIWKLNEERPRMNYEYDVFLSYKHTSIFGRWVEARFLPLFRDYLMEELGSREPPPIFFDRRELRAAEPFPLKIRHALATSR